MTAPRSAPHAPGLSLPAFGLLCYLQGELRWSRAGAVDAEPGRLKAGQLRVSVGGLARRFRCGRRKVLAALRELTAAGWFRATSGPSGLALTCLRDPRDHNQQQPDGGQGGAPAGGDSQP